MCSLLCELEEIAYKLYKIQCRQTSGDIEYFIAWIRSSAISDSGHLGPTPAGENTVDLYSHNCPIPYTASLYIIDGCTDYDYAEYYLYKAKDIFTTLLSKYTSIYEQTAIHAYLDYIDDLLYLIKGEEPIPPEPPTPPEPEGTNSYIASDKSEITLVPNMYYVLYDSSASEFEYDYKQVSEVVGVYNSEDKPVECDIQIKSLHDGTSWKLYAFTTQENVTINRVKFNTTREAIDYIILGGLMTNAVDKPWIIREIFSNMYTDQ